MKLCKDFPPNNRLVSDVELSSEAIASAERLLQIGNKLHEAITELDDLLPEGSYHQFYGNWDILIVRQGQDNSERDE